ncbi:hypothetical protein FB451DRAFT_1385297 [Mycena latifolia]|nr:hypothetical protein FB451DRAFT_1385297 [Mycena latifolia]
MQEHFEKLLEDLHLGEKPHTSSPNPRAAGFFSEPARRSNTHPLHVGIIPNEAVAKEAAGAPPRRCRAASKPLVSPLPGFRAPLARGVVYIAEISTPLSPPFGIGVSGTRYAYRWPMCDLSSTAIGASGLRLPQTCPLTHRAKRERNERSGRRSAVANARLVLHVPLRLGCPRPLRLEDGGRERCIGAHRSHLAWPRSPAPAAPACCILRAQMLEDFTAASSHVGDAVGWSQKICFYKTNPATFRSLSESPCPSSAYPLVSAPAGITIGEPGHARAKEVVDTQHTKAAAFIRYIKPQHYHLARRECKYRVHARRWLQPENEDTSRVRGPIFLGPRGALLQRSTLLGLSSPAHASPDTACPAAILGAQLLKFSFTQWIIPSWSRAREHLRRRVDHLVSLPHQPRRARSLAIMCHFRHPQYHRLIVVQK